LSPGARQRHRGHFTTPFTLTAFLSHAGAHVALHHGRLRADRQQRAVSRLAPISNTTLFRIAAFKAKHLPAKTVTHTYFFNLPANVRSLPVISIVTASNNLYGPSGILGIMAATTTMVRGNRTAPNDYHNPSKHGLAWERRTSVEWIQPETTPVSNRLRHPRARQRLPAAAPDSHAASFPSASISAAITATARLDYPLFPLTGVQKFDQLVLRAGFNEQYNPFIRDEIHRRSRTTWARSPSHGTLAVVFVNGQYYASSPWYNPTERVHEEFFQEHLGGSATGMWSDRPSRKARHAWRD
jgi:hypothetical protein